MKKDSKKKPFFASFLEKQIKNPEEIQGGGIISSPTGDVTTLPTNDTVVTSRTLDNVTLPTYDTPVTLKYPSDNDEIGFEPGIDPVKD
ncbi:MULTISPECIES: microviridin/marinostatin family tricyclic proteinase inhibitor [Chryseobacterium]|jgi:hypothetical protein|uniref:Serine endopeptidase inhibitor I10-like protein n=1 Tax=Chryseobacterium geocarposphaerae TaxID=1416776 RepID=A0ABU1LAW1_9FLAO|nr:MULTISPECIES: microviridin/marinostatin family tricyclic proteinase inhibitor [Chryseobacterium]MDR6403861.1 hypothetical protein [Chryseobacterium geocarposphaerae]MDR6698620.1 hypothetical protein [Chryseobacterium ginsenosidimutans]